MKKILFFMGFMSLLVSFGNEGWVKLYKLAQFEKTLDEQNRILSENNKTLQREIENLKNPKYLEYYIRRETGYLRENEIIYEVVTPQKP